MKIPLFLEAVEAGFPGVVEDALDKSISLDEHLIRHPEATYFVRVKGDSMQDDGIFSGDILIVDKVLEARNNSVVIASIDSEFTVKRMQKNSNSITLIPSNINYKPIKIDPESDFEIWGVVTYVVHSLT